MAPTNLSGRVPKLEVLLGGGNPGSRLPISTNVQQGDQIEMCILHTAPYRRASVISFDTIHCHLSQQLFYASHDIFGSKKHAGLKSRDK
jgi:hypothetical protein